MGVAQMHEIHIRRWIERAQGAVQIDRVGLKTALCALRQHHLHAVTGGDVVFTAQYIAFERSFPVIRSRFVLGKPRAGWQNRRAAQLIEQGLQTRQRTLIRIFLSRVGVNSEIDFTQQVIDYGQLLGQHQVQIRNGDIVRGRAVCEFVLNLTHGVVSKITNQTAAVTCVTIKFRYFFAL